MAAPMSLGAPLLAPAATGHYATGDMSVAAYLYRVKELRLLSARRKGERFEFVFSDPQGLAPAFAAEFGNSCCCKFDDGVRYLKKLLAHPANGT